MPPLEETDFEQVVVVWTKTGINRFNEPTLANPVEVDCRWIDKRTQTIDREGKPLALDVLLICAELLNEGQLVWYGALADWNPSIKNELLEIMTVKHTPSSNGRFQRNEYGLRKFRQKLPT